MDGRRPIGLALREANRARIAAMPAPQFFVPLIGHPTNINPERWKSYGPKVAPHTLERRNSILRQNVNLAKFLLNLLYTLGAARVVIAVVPARYSGPATFIWHDRN